MQSGSHGYKITQFVLVSVMTFLWFNVGLLERLPAVMPQSSRYQTITQTKCSFYLKQQPATPLSNLG